MTTSNKVAIILAVTLLVVLAILGKLAYDEHAALATAEATTAASQKTLADLVQRISDRDKADAQQQKDAQTAVANVKTSADAVQVITKYIPVPVGAPPAAAVAAKQDFTPEAQAKLPDSPSYVVQTQDAATATAKDLISCAADRSSLNTCKADLADFTQAVATEKSDAATWRQVAKGGSKAHKFFKVLKCAGMAGAGTAIAIGAGQSKWAPLGAAAGVVGCQLF